jgi:hypothetical protein
MGVFGGGIPDTVPVSDEGIEIDRSPVDLLSESDIEDVEDLQGEIPETEGGGEYEDLGGGEEAEVVDGIPETGAPAPERWNIDETLEIIGEDGLNQCITFANNFIRKLAEKNLSRPARQDLTEEQIKKTHIARQLVKAMHHYAPSLPMDSPSTGLAICCITLVAMNLTSPLLPKDATEPGKT